MLYLKDKVTCVNLYSAKVAMAVHKQATAFRFSKRNMLPRCQGGAVLLHHYAKQN